MWEFGVLGPIEVRGAGGLLDLGGRRQRALLARLLVARGAVVSVERLLDDVFRGEPPATALGSLLSCVSALRRTLRPCVLVSRAPGYALHARDVDADEFERLIRRAGAVPDLDEALALWRGTPYADAAGEPWTTGEVERLTDLFLLAHEQRLSMLLTRGESAAVIPELRRLTADHPYRERLWCLLALALYRCGQQSDALFVLRLARDVFADELQREPHELRRLEMEIGNRTASLHLPPPRAELPPPPAKATPSDPFVGREHALGELGRLAGDAEWGMPRLAVITAEPGMGKTRLLAAAAAGLSRRGWSVLWVDCVADAPPLHPWRELLRRTGPSTGPQESDVTVIREPRRAEPCDSADDTALAPLVAERAEHGAATPEEARQAMDAAVTRHLETLAQSRPLMVVFDDLHSADLTTLDLLEHAATKARGPILLAAAATTVRPLGDTRLRLEGLDEDAIGTMAEAMGTRVSGETVAKIGTITSGNPFFTREALRLAAGTDDPDQAALDALDDGVCGVVRRGLARLPPAARSTLEIAAVLQAGFDAAVIAQVAQHAGRRPSDVEEIEEALDLAVVIGVLTHGHGTGLRFGHDTAREILEGDLPAPERATLHRCALRALRERPSVPPAVLARHAFAALHPPGPGPEAAADRPAAVSWGVAAAREAEARLAHADAVRWWSRAAHLAGEARVAEFHPVELLLGQIGAQLHAGDHEGARQTRRRALVLAGQKDDPVLTARVLTSLDGPALWTRPPYRMIEHDIVSRLEQGLAALPYGDTGLRCRMFATLAGELYGVAPPDRVASLAAESLAMARRLGEPGLVATALHNRLHAIVRAGQDAEARLLATDLIEVADANDLPGYALAARMVLLGVLAEGFEPDEADRCALACEALLARTAVPGAAFASRVWRSTRDILAGRPFADDAFGREPTGGDHVFGDAAALAVVHRVMACYNRGHLAGTVGLVEEMRAGPWREFAGCLRAVHDGVPPADPPPEPSWAWLSLMCLRAEAQARAGDVTGGEATYRALLPHAGRLATGHGLVPVGPVGYHLGRLAALLDRHNEARAHFRDAHERCVRAGLDVWATRLGASI